MSLTIVRLFFAKGVREDRFARSRWLSWGLSLAISAVLSIYLFQIGAGPASAWSEQTIFRAVSWLVWMSGIGTYLSKTSDDRELDFLRVVPISPADFLLAKLSEGAASSIWGTIPMLGLFLGWSFHSEQVNLILAVSSFCLTYVHMHVLSLAIALFINVKSMSRLRNILTRTAIGATLAVMVAIVLWGGQVGEFISHVKGFGQLVGVYWYAMAAASTGLGHVLKSTAVGATELVGTLAFLLVMARRALEGRQYVEVPNRRPISHLETRMDMRDRSPTMSMIHKDLLLAHRHWFKLVGAIIMSLVMILVLMSVNFDNSGLEPQIRDLMAVLMAVVTQIGPGLILTSRVFAEDYGFLGVLRLTVNMRQYVLSKFMLPFIVGSILSLPTALALKWLLGASLWVMITISVVTAMVVASSGLAVGAARLYFGANPHKQDFVSWLSAAAVIYVYTMLLIVPQILTGSPMSTIASLPVWVVISALGILLTSSILVRQDLSH